MGNVQGRRATNKGKNARDSSSLCTVTVAGERLTATLAGTEWTLNWRSDERKVDAGELVVLEDANGRWWHLIVPGCKEPSVWRPMAVREEFRKSGDSSIIVWNEEDRIGGRTFAVGRCGRALRNLAKRAESHDQERRYVVARSDYSRRLNRATRAAVALGKCLAALCEAENGRPWSTEVRDGQEAALHYSYAFNNVPNSQRRRGSLWPVQSLGKIAKLIISKLREWQALGRQGRGRPPDRPVAAIESPLRAMGLSDSEIAQQRQFCGLEVALIVRPDRRLKGAGYAREKSRDHRRPRRSGTRKRSK
jgi:hypothetical protein